jgi:simple sugar transport system substrate-binding protein
MKFKHFFSIFLACIFCLLVASPQAFAKEFEIAVVVKIAGIPWFNTMEKGVVQAAKDLGVNAYMTGPAEADEAQQVKIVEDLISKGVDAIGVVPNDAKSLEPAFQRAQQKGIVIITNESPNQRFHTYNYEMIDNTAFGEFHWDEMVKHAGADANYAVFVGGLTVPAHNIWADAGLAHAKTKYPKMNLVTKRIPCAEDQGLSRQRTLELIKAYPDLDGIIAFGSLGPPGAAQAVKEKGLIGKIHIIGTVIPKHAAPYLKDGSLTLGTLWNPVDSGYAMVYIAKMVLEGKNVTKDSDIPRMGKPVSVDGKFITFNAMKTFTAENVDQFDF